MAAKGYRDIQCLKQLPDIIKESWHMQTVIPVSSVSGLILAK
jgi:hypothetical protein